MAGTSDERTFSVKVEQYVPLQIEFEPRVLSIDETYYWRSTNGNYLLEIKVHASNGAAAELRLTLVPRGRMEMVRSISIPPLQSATITKRGLPLFQTKPWKDRIGQKEIGIDPALRRYDESRPFRYLVADDGVAILFDGQVSHSSVQNGSVRFLFTSQGELSGIRVEDRKVGAAAIAALA